jgi:16S rRNA (uracil1498-N3)-methyltransferase
MRRFFFKPKDRVGEMVVLSKEEAYHMRTVLRLQPGTHVELLDGLGGVYQAELVDLSGPVRARILSGGTEREDAGVRLEVGQGMLKGKNMDMVIQKCTELGVNGLAPLLTTRCQGRPDPARDRKRHGRWLKIVDEACKQCGRSRPMELQETTDFKDMIDDQGPGANILRVLFWEGEREVHLKDLVPFQDTGRIRIVLGPEGGFTDLEIAVAREAGWSIVSLGPRILRAETASLAAVAIMQHHLGVL